MDRRRQSLATRRNLKWAAALTVAVVLALMWLRESGGPAGPAMSEVLYDRPFLLQARIDAYRQWLKTANLSRPQLWVPWAPWSGVMVSTRDRHSRMGINNVLIGIVNAANLASISMTRPVLVLPAMLHAYLPDHPEEFVRFDAIFDIHVLRAALAALGFVVAVEDDGSAAAAGDAGGATFPLPHMFEQREVIEGTRTPVDGMVDVARRLIAEVLPLFRPPGALLDFGPSSVVNMSMFPSLPAKFPCWICAHLDSHRDSHVALSTLRGIRFRFGAAYAPGIVERLRDGGRTLTVGLHFRAESDWSNFNERSFAAVLAAKLAGQVRAHRAARSDAAAVAVYVASGLLESSPRWAALVKALESACPLPLRVVSKTSTLPASAMLEPVHPLHLGGVDQEVLLRTDVFIAECDSSLSFHVLLLRLLGGAPVETSECWNGGGYVPSAGVLLEHAYFPTLHAVTA